MRTTTAQLFALLDLPSASSIIVRHGPYEDGFSALGSLPVGRLPEAVTAALQDDNPEAALALIVRARQRGEMDHLSPLVFHRSPSVRAAVLGVLPPSQASLSDLVEILGEDDPETALPAAYALAASDPALPEEDRAARRAALVERAGGVDGPGRSAALIALAETDDPGTDLLIRSALGAEDPEVRQAAASAAAHRSGLGVGDLLPCLADPEPLVRAAALRSIAAWAT